MAKIGFIGLGRMGQGMAARLLSAKHQVTVWNRSPDKAAALVSSGATLAETPAAAARDADAIFTMLANDDAAERVWRAHDGVLSTARSGAFAIECSTLSRDFVVALGQEARQRGLRFLDCPVTGRPNVAAAGELTLLVGAETVDLDAARSLLDSIATTIRHFGPVGTGTAYKLMINLMGSVQIAALAEGLALSERLGLDREAVIAAISDSAAASRQVVYHVTRMARRDFADPTFTAGLRHKDADYGAALAKTVGIDIPLGRASVAWFAETMAPDPNVDEARVIETVLAQAAK
jgi:3-hydroxyisobutyrate dehydrogenase